MMNYLGEFAALVTALCWTGTAIAFEFAGKRIGSFTMNFLRLILAFLFYAVYSLWVHGSFFPMNFPVESWMWLILSGLVGFVLGDWLLFQAYVDIGARISLVIMSLWPAMAAFLAWFFLGERMRFTDLLGLILVTAGIAIVIVSGKDFRKDKNGVRKKALPVLGILMALGGAFGQAGGMVLSKVGMQDHDPFSSSYIRVIAATLGFGVLFTVTGRWKRLRAALSDSRAMTATTVGAFIGPFLGVSFSLLAIQHTSTGVAS
ncbi:MAG: DMT family transporter, partial [Bacteroidales bacterium]|nr:DMT family transporter [Bacteroidales bacterium]